MVRIGGGNGFLGGSVGSGGVGGRVGPVSGRVSSNDMAGCGSALIGLALLAILLTLLKTLLLVVVVAVSLFVVVRWFASHPSYRADASLWSRALVVAALLAIYPAGRAAYTDISGYAEYFASQVDVPDVDDELIPAAVSELREAGFTVEVAGDGDGPLGPWCEASTARDSDGDRVRIRGRDSADVRKPLTLFGVCPDVYFGRSTTVAEARDEVPAGHAIGTVTAADGGVVVDDCRVSEQQVRPGRALDVYSDELLVVDLVVSCRR